MYKKIILSFFIIFSAVLKADIMEIDHIDEVRPYIIQQNALFLFDIDDTLITNPFSLGRPAWRNWAKINLPKGGKEFVLYDALTLYIAKNAPYQPVESTTAQLISDLQQQGFPVFAFTARGRSEWYTSNIKGVDDFTHQQLNNVGIDFAESFIPSELQFLEQAYFYKGIIFAQHIPKGDLLKHLFKDLNYQPSCIIFIDDKLDQVKSVEAAAKESEIPFFGFWYRRVEFDGANFNPMLASIQLENILLNNRIASDVEAEEIVKNMQENDPKSYVKWIFDQYEINQLKPHIEN